MITGLAGGLGRAPSAALTDVGAQVAGIDLPRTDATVTADLTDDDSGSPCRRRCGDGWAASTP
jgi:nucleoside-diphosphate-sugar epimerase